MTTEIEHPLCRHSAAYLDNHIVIFGGINKNDKPLSARLIWMYNLYTEEWSKHVIPDTSAAPEPFSRAVTTVIDGTIYTFGGINAKAYDKTNELWTLTRAELGCFTWSFIEPQCKEESPSPRSSHTGWEYAGNLWIFGGAGLSPEGYLNDHGATSAGFSNFTTNNQLLYYNPNTQKWINPQCFGAVPSPRSGHVCATLKDKVWLFGGWLHSFTFLDDIFELTMLSLTWTQIQTSRPWPQAREFCTLTTITDNHLVLHGGKDCKNQLTVIWIMNLTSHSWRQYTLGKDHARWGHTSSPGLSSNVIHVGGFKYHGDSYEVYENVFHVMLEPKCLQQLTMQKIHRHQDELPWNCLPVKLISLLGISV